MAGDNIVGDSIDFFNPMEDLKDVTEAANSFFNWLLTPFVDAADYIRSKQRTVQVVTSNAVCSAI